jgi:hypothetical protein
VAAAAPVGPWRSNDVERLNAAGRERQRGWWTGERDLEHLERLGVPSAPVQRQHELRAQALAEWMTAYEGIELCDELEVAPESQLRPDALLQAVELLLGESGLLEPRERFLELRKRRPSPELERSAECCGGLACSTLRECLAALRGELLEAAKVERVSVELDEVARCPRGQKPVR